MKIVKEYSDQLPTEEQINILAEIVISLAGKEAEVLDTGTKDKDCA